MSNPGEQSTTKKRKKISSYPSQAKLALKASLLNAATSQCPDRTPINELTIDSKMVVIVGRLVWLHEIISPQQKIPMLHLSLLDNTGEIKVIIWREQITKWKQQLTINEVYKLVRFRITTCDKRFTRFRPGTLSLEFTKWTECNLIVINERDQSLYPTLKWTPVELSNFPTMDQNEFECLSPIDIIGMVLNTNIETHENRVCIQLHLRNEIENEEIFVSKVELLLYQLPEHFKVHEIEFVTDFQKIFKNGKTIVRLKGVNIFKQSFPLKGKVYQDSIIELNPSYLEIPTKFKEWIEAVASSEDEDELSIENEENEKSTLQGNTSDQKSESLLNHEDVKKKQHTNQESDREIANKAGKSLKKKERK